MSRGVCGLLFLALALAAGEALAAQRDARSAEAPTPAGERPGDDHAVTEADRLYQVAIVPTAAAPRIDGDLDDEVWRQARVLDDFSQSQPDEGAAASERTEVRILFDRESIYIAARLYDSEPDRIVSTVLRRDEDHNDNDAFAVTLDTYHDHRNGYFFETNALGARFDAQIIGEGGGNRLGSGTTFNRDWDAVWYAAGRLTDEGWQVEIEIPFWSLRFDRDSMEAWGINFRRSIRRKSEQDYWAPVPRQYDASRLSLSGMLVGMQNVARPRNLQIKPFLRGDVGQFPDGPVGDPFATHRTDPSGDVGGDIKWAITPNLTLDGTVNTDFAQVEADDVQVNLTRFPLFFPEKREFFLENAGLFQFGGSSSRGGPRVIGFHSRRIGIDAGGEVPILAGARLTGKAGPWSIGTLTMQTGAVDARGLGSTNHSVARVRRDLGERSSVGMLFTNRQAGSDDYNRAFGVDGRWAVGGAIIDGWWMRTTTPGFDGESEWAGGTSLQWSSSNWNVNAAAMQVGDTFNPELGFVNRRDLRSFNSTIMWTPFFPDSPAVRNLTPHFSFAYVTDRTGRLLSRFQHFDWDVFLKRGDKLSLAHNRYFEQLDVPFEIVPGVIIPPGAFHYDENNLELVSDQSRPYWASLMYTWGDFWNGNRKNWQLSAGVKPSARLSMSLSLDRNDVELPGGDFVTDLWRARIAYDVNTRLFVSGLFQYDTLSDQFLTNVRLNFIHTPGADLFLVYNERRLTEDPNLIDRALILKVTQLFRL